MASADKENFLQRLEWRLFKTMRRMRLKNRNATIIADNCNAGFIMHDMGMRFNTPTVNLFFRPADYLRFLKELPHYLTLEPTELADANVKYPMGLLGDIPVHFMHYGTFALAHNKWMERAQRVDFNNLYVMMTEKTGCTMELMKEFDALPFDHKVLFTHIPYPELKCAFYVPGFEDKECLGVLSDFRPGFFRRRFFDVFDYVSFLDK